MGPKSEVTSEILEVIDNALTAALREIRRARAMMPVPESAAGAGGKKSTSRIRLCSDVLAEAGRPLHVTAMIEALAARGVSATRDSLVSALTKQLAPHGPFVRTAGNTFGLAVRDKPVDGER